MSGEAAGDHDGPIDDQNVSKDAPFAAIPSFHLDIDIGDDDDDTAGVRAGERTRNLFEQRRL